jgi:putative DNA primase/helicase
LPQAFAPSPILETALIEGAKKDSYTKISNWIYAYHERREPTKHTGSSFASNQSSTDWHGIFIATSEASFDEFARIAKAKRDNGEYARCTDVPVLREGYKTIFDRSVVESGIEMDDKSARQELSRLRDECEVNCGVAAHDFIRKLPLRWSDHPAFIKTKVNEFVAAVGGDKLTNINNHVTKNFGVIYAGARLAIEEKILPRKQRDLLECIRSCFFDAMGGITNPDGILNAGKAMLREALRDPSSDTPLSRPCS